MTYNLSYKRKVYITMNKKINTYQITVTALMTALMCILGPISIPIGAVPISITIFAILLSVMLLGTKLGTLSYVLYLILGVVGLPVFSGYSGGPAKLAGPTGGYLIGFIGLALITGLFIDVLRNKTPFTIIGMVLGLLFDYLLGTIWFAILMKCEFLSALTVCVFPFILFDAIKIALAFMLGTLIRIQLIKTGLIVNKQKKAATK